MPKHSNRIDIKSCKVKEPPHPCDPPPKCDICDEGDEQCPEPKLCTERIKNPQKPHETRCKPGAFIGTSACVTKEPPHPCDGELPCEPGKPKKEPCSDPALCKQKIKNPEKAIVRCPGPEDLLAPKEVCEYLDSLRKPIPVCPKESCPKIIQINPFDFQHDKDENDEEGKRKMRPYYYSHKDLCDNLDILRKEIQECTRPRCSPPIQINPFEAEEERKKYQQDEEEEDPCKFEQRR